MRGKASIAEPLMASVPGALSPAGHLKWAPPTATAGQSPTQSVISRDASDLINTMIRTKASDGGGTVRLVPGVYEIHSSLRMLSNVSLEGAGRDATVIRVMPGQFTGAALVGASGDAVVGAAVRDLTVDVNYPASQAAINGIQVSNGDHFAVSGVRVTNAGANGVLFLGLMGGVSRDPVVENSVVEGSGRASTSGDNGFGVLGIDTSGLVVKDNAITQNTGMGVGLTLSRNRMVGSPGAVISGNVIQQASSPIGFEAIGLTVKCDGARITDNVIVDSQDNGISVSSDHNVVTGNHIDGTSDHGVAIGGSYNDVSRNSVEHAGRKSASGPVLAHAGIALDGSHNRLVENVVSDDAVHPTMAYGVKQNAVVGDNWLEHNHISGWLLAKYHWTPRQVDHLSPDNVVIEP